jgi:cysteine desulfuration protein SufE
MSLEEKKQQLISRFSGLTNSQARYSALIKIGREQPSLPEDKRQPQFLVEGCLSRLWFIPELQNGLCYFTTDSDSIVVKAIASIVSNLYSNETPEVILANPPDFLEQLRLHQHLTGNRRNGLTRLWEKISSFAAAHRQSL